MQWQPLIDAIHEHHSQIDLHLNPGVSLDDIAAAEKQLSVTFPRGLVQLLTDHNGQVQNELRLSVGPQPIPPLPLGDGHFCTSGDFLPLSRIVDATLVNRTLAEYDVPPYDADWDLVGPVRLHRDQIVISDPGSGDIIAIDLAPPPEGTLGQIIAINHDPSAVCIIASDLQSFFDLLIDGYRNGRFSWRQEDGFLEPTVYD